MFLKKDKIGQLLLYFSIFFTIFGGALLLAIIFLTFMSIFGRVFFSRSLLGYFEIVELMSACIIFSFLPICQIKRGNLILEFFTSNFNETKRKIMDLSCHLILSIVYFFFTLYMFLGAVDMFIYNEETMLMRIPIWIGFIPAIFSFFLLFLISFYFFSSSIVNILR